MSNGTCWMPFYVGDYLRDTGHLSTAEHGALLLLLFHAWPRNGVLPTDETRLRRITKMDPKEWAASRETLLEFFYLSEEGYRQKRLDRELERTQSLVEQKQGEREASAERMRRMRARNNGSHPHPKPDSSAGPVTRNMAVTDTVTEGVTPPSQEPSRYASVTPSPQVQPVPEVPPVREEEREENNSLSLGNAREDGGSREQKTTPERSSFDAELDALRDAPISEDPAICGLVSSIAKSRNRRLNEKRPYGEVRSREAQADAILAHPAVVGSDMAMGLKWEPADPVRSIQEQAAAMLAGCSPEQIAKAQRYAARAAP